MARELSKVGGACGLIAAGTFVIGLMMYATVLIDYTRGSSPYEAVAFLIDHRLSLYLWNMIITIVFGVVLVPLVLALRDAVVAASPALANSGSAFGLIWAGLIIATGMISNIGYGVVSDLQAVDPARAVTVWVTLDAVQNGLGGGNEIVGGLWVLMVSAAAWRGRILLRWVTHLGMLLGLTGLVTVVPPLEGAGIFFGLGLILWFIMVGVALLRNRGDVAQATIRPQSGPGGMVNVDSQIAGR
jgi:hypothetical protein